MVGWRVVFGFAALAPLGFGCATTLRHDFVAQLACDVRNGGSTPQARAEAAILLIPGNVEVFAPGDGGLSERKMLDYELNWHEDYVGPARVFLMPGPHQYSVKVTTSNGAADFDLNLPLKPAERYQLQVSEQADKVAIGVLRLTDEDYRALYPHATADAACRR